MFGGNRIKQLFPWEKSNVLTGGELSIVWRILGALRDAWKRVNPYAQIAELRRDIELLKTSLERCPAEGCPYCGKRAWRLKEVEMLGQCETWHCLECAQEREYRYDLPGQLPPGVRPNRSTSSTNR
jgi:hypothetical protein